MVADTFEPFVLEEDEDLVPDTHPVLDDEEDESGGAEFGEDEDEESEDTDLGEDDEDFG